MDLRIEAPLHDGAPLLRISGAGARRILRVEPGRRVELYGFVVADGIAVDDGGCISSAGELVLEQVHVTGCRAANGGGIHATGPVTLRDVVLADNQASAWGGALFLSGGPLDAERAEFVRNEAVRGAGIHVQGTSNARIAGSVFQSNTASDLGGGLNLFDVEAETEATRFEENQAAYGGAVYSQRSSLRIYATRFEANAVTLSGGALQVGDSILAVERSDFRANSAGQGGAMNLETDFGAYTVRSSTFQHNQATLAGGGVHAQSVDHLRIENSTFLSNHADTGGAIAGSYSRVVLAFNTIAENSAS